jgi:prenyltransferase beta subunit
MRTIAAILALSIAGQSAPAQLAPEAPGSGAQASDAELTPETRDAIDRGLAFLASQQAESGSIGGNAGNAETGITSLAAIAFMSAGNLPGRGRYGQVVERALDFVLDNAQESGLLAGEDSHGVMYAHGFATLFLAEVYGMTGDARVREALNKAVRLLHRAQNAEGGWRYTPQPVDADISVTICQVMALRAARDAGIKVDREVIERAIDYVKRCQNQDGGFSYTLHDGVSQFPRSAAGVATLFYAGIYEGPEVERGLKYVADFMPGPTGARVNAHYFYGHYYAVQTMFLAGGSWWRDWYPAIREELLARQDRSTGGWTGDVSPAYSTAMALIILQMPNRYLPVFIGKGPGS